MLSRRVILASAFAGLLRAQKAEVSNFDFSLLDEGPVPAELFFVREHFPAPGVTSADWKIAFTGALAKPSEFPYEELLAMPRKVLPVTLECAENPVGGGLVSHAEWTGLSLASLLERVQIRPEARFVRLSGADGFSHALPLAKAMHPDTLLAYQMNGERLPANHGFPIRALVPGWYGMDSVKWLRSVEVLEAEDRLAEPRYERMTRSLLTGTRPAGLVTAMQVKSAFSRPLEGAILSNRRFTLRGAAWAGENRVRRVELSPDGGKSWQEAGLGSERSPYAWTLWSLEWKIPGPGAYEWTVRAEDEAGRSQPRERASERADGFELNSWQTVRVTVL